MTNMIELCVDKYGKDSVVPSVNVMQRKHWSYMHKTIKKLRLFILNEMRLKGVKKVSKSAKYSLLIVSYRKRLLDPDNLYASHKWMIDSLRKEKFIWDDDPDHLELNIQQEKSNKTTGEKMRTVIVRERLSN